MARDSNPGVDMAQRRRAIYQGLKQYLEGDDLLNALCIWQQHYAHLPRFAITSYVRRITDGTNLENTRVAIHLSLTSALMLGEDSLGADPLAAMRRYLAARVGNSEAAEMLGGGQDAGEETPAQTDRMRVFEQLMEAFFERITTINKATARDMRQALIDSLAHIDMDPARTQAISTWLQGDSKRLEMEIETEQLQQLLHQAYIIACNRLGPVRADELLSEALQASEHNSGGKQLSPRDWL